MPLPQRKPLPMTPYQSLVENWKNCTACELHVRRHKVVFARGTAPCDVLFIGEGPGASENLIGQPFVGPAGDLLDHIIARGLRGASYCITNLVMCIPHADVGSKRKVKEPDYDSVMSCKPRLEYFIEHIAKPKIVVSVGRCAESYLNQVDRDSVRLPPGIIQAHITHPSAILSSNIANLELQVQSAVVELRDALLSLEDDERARTAGQGSRSFLNPADPDGNIPF